MKIDLKDRLEKGKRNFVYLSGKITGLEPEVYRKNFDECREWLKSMIPDEYQIITPTDLCKDDWDWYTCMDICVDVMKQCIAVYFMPDWRDSKGATCERYIAEANGLRIIDIDIYKYDVGIPEEGLRDYYFLNPVIGFTDKLTNSIEYKRGDIVVLKDGSLKDGSVLDYQGYYGTSNTLYTLLIDTNLKIHFHEDYYVDKNLIAGLADIHQATIFKCVLKKYINF